MATHKELMELSAEELENRAKALRETLFQDQLKRRTGSLEKPTERTAHRRDLARVLTAQTQKSKAAK